MQSLFRQSRNRGLRIKDLHVCSVIEFRRRTTIQNELIVDEGDAVPPSGQMWKDRRTDGQTAAMPSAATERAGRWLVTAGGGQTSHVRCTPLAADFPTVSFAVRTKLNSAAWSPMELWGGVGQDRGFPGMG